jgi:hypothetical protein
MSAAAGSHMRSGGTGGGAWCLPYIVASGSRLTVILPHTKICSLRGIRFSCVKYLILQYIFRTASRDLLEFASIG